MSGKGLRFLRQVLPDILAKRTDVLSPRMVRIVADLASDWRQLDERIEPVTDEIETLAKSDGGCRRVMTVPGIGPIISSAMIAAIGNGAACKSSRVGRTDPTTPSAIRSARNEAIRHRAPRSRYLWHSSSGRTEESQSDLLRRVFAAVGARVGRDHHLER